MVLSHGHFLTNTSFKQRTNPSDYFANTSFKPGVTYLNTPRIGNPFCTATLLFIRRTAPAPSLTWLEFPVTYQKNW